MNKPSTDSLSLPRPLITGLPPQRIYIHPDEQIELLKKENSKNKKDKPTNDADDDGIKPEREWVLPTHLREKWSLKKLAEVFDAIDNDAHNLAAEKAHVSCDGNEPEVSSSRQQKRAKRILLATVGDDSTVVYYIVHDGIVKPRQN